MPNENNPATTSQESSPWAKLLREWKGLGWPAIAAVMGALFFFYGYVAEKGRIAALGVYNLDLPAFSQQYVMKGVVCLAELGLQLVLVTLVGVALQSLCRLIFSRTPTKLQERIREWPHKVWWGRTVVLLAIITLGSALWIVKDLADSADGLILKNAKDAGDAWLTMSIDPYQSGPILYQLVLAALLAIFIGLSWWILLRFVAKKGTRILFGMFVILEILNVTTGYAFLYGVGATFTPFPIVSLTNIEQLFEKHDLAVLLGSDDRQFAFLIVRGVGEKEPPSPRKVILYLPRSEIKAMAVIDHLQLHPLARYEDEKGLSPGPSLAPKTPIQEPKQ